MGKKTQRTRYHPLVGGYKIRADAAARIEPKMATIARVLGQPCHDGFIAKTVPNILVRYSNRQLNEQCRQQLSQPNIEHGIKFERMGRHLRANVHKHHMIAPVRDLC